MTKHEALTSMGQTLLRLRGFTKDIDALPGPLDPELVPIHLRITMLGNIARVIHQLIPLVDADQSDEQQAVWEIGRRYAVWG